jgi:hypothetical protein
MQDANALGAFLTPALQGAPKIWLPPRDSKRFLAIIFPQWTFLDVLERPWMVGRVGIEPTTN